jgi:hypothetical protein
MKRYTYAATPELRAMRDVELRIAMEYLEHGSDELKAAEESPVRVHVKPPLAACYGMMTSTNVSTTLGLHVSAVLRVSEILTMYKLVLISSKEDVAMFAVWRPENT